MNLTTATNTFDNITARVSTGNKIVEIAQSKVFHTFETT